MLNVLLLSSLLAAQEAPPTAASLVSKMFARYYGAKTLTGTVRTTQTANQTSVVTDTALSYERPSMIRIEQTQKGPTVAKTRMIVSDGAQVAYTPPERIVAPPPFLVEPVAAPDGSTRTIGDLYTLVASDLPDRSPLLDAMIARPDDLKYFANQLASFSLKGRVKIDGREVNLIEGDWRETDLRNKGDADRHVGDASYVRDTFKLYISDAGDLVRYELVQHFGAPIAIPQPGKPKPPIQTILVTTVWEASIVVDGAIRPGTFALRTR